MKALLVAIKSEDFREAGDVGLIPRRKHKNSDNRFSVLSECMTPSTPASQRKDGTVMESCENTIINTHQYVIYRFDKSTVKTKKSRLETSGLNPVNKTVSPAHDRDNLPPRLSVLHVGSRILDQKIEILKRSRRKEAEPRCWFQRDNVLSSELQGTRLLTHQMVDTADVTSKYAKKTIKGDDRNPRAQSTLHKVEEAPTQNKVKRLKVPGSKKIKDNTEFPEHQEMMVPVKVETLDSLKTRSIQSLIDTGCTDSCVELQKLAVPR
jgi:hypothetical protein